MKDSFSIGQLGSLFGLNIQTLYYYDSIGLFSPRVRNERTGRRKYEFDQIYELATVCYMRRLGYSLEEIREYRATQHAEKSIDHMKQRSAALRKQWQEIFDTDEAIQRKIHFIEKQMDGIDTSDISVRHFPDRKFLPIGEEEMLYCQSSFYFYPTLAFYEGERKYFGAYLNPDGGHIPESIPESQIQMIPEGDFLCGYHVGRYSSVPDTIERIRSSRPDLNLDNQAINVNILDQFVESDKSKFITLVQIRIK